MGNAEYMGTIITIQQQEQQNTTSIRSMSI